MINIKRKSSKKTVFIHIGLMKTGTSAIQSMLWNNTSFFLERDYFIPRINHEANNYLGFSLLDEIPPMIHIKLKSSREDIYRRLLREINHSKAKNVVLSAEAFSLISTEEFIGENAPIYLKHFFDSDKFDVKIIAFIRRQDEYLESQYNQHVKTHNFWNLYDEDIESFYKLKAELFDFKKIISKWSKVFGIENVKIAAYKSKVDVRVEFLKLIGLTNYDKLPLSSNLINEKLGLKALDFMRTANKFGIKKQSVKQNYELIEIISATLKAEDKYGSILSPERKKQVLDSYSKDNLEISNMYLDADTSWFTGESISDEIDYSEMKINIEECVKVATAIWNHFQKDSN